MLDYLALLMLKLVIFPNVFFWVSGRTFMEKIVTWIETILKGSNNKVANFWGPIRVRANFKDKEQIPKFSVDV